MNAKEKAKLAELAEHLGIDGELDLDAVVDAAQDELKGRQAKLAAIEARAAGSESGDPLPSSDSAATLPDGGSHVTDDDFEAVHADLKVAEGKVEALTSKLAAMAGALAAFEEDGKPVCFILVTKRFRFENRTFRPGMSVLNPTGPMLRLIGDEDAAVLCSAREFANADRPLSRDSKGEWMSWVPASDR